MRTFDKSRIVLASGCLGIARAAYEYAAQYARERVQFGKPILEHQAVGSGSPTSRCASMWPGC